MMKKKAQIATTITWAVAFTIILFLMIIFLVVTTALSGKELFNKNEIGFEEGAENLDSQRELIKILNSPVNVDEAKNVKELIKLWYGDKEKYKDILESEVKKVLSDFEYDYLDFRTKILSVRGWRGFVSLNKKELIDFQSENFISGYCIDDLSGRCVDLAGVYVPVESGFVYIAIQGSQGAKK